MHPVAVAATAFAAIYGVSHEDHAHAFVSYYVLLGGMCLWGVAYAVYGGAQQALLADSTPTQGRVYYFTKLNQISLVASALGPIISITLFLVKGDVWSKENLRDVVLGALRSSCQCLSRCFYTGTMPRWARRRRRRRSARMAHPQRQRAAPSSTIPPAEEQGADENPKAAAAETTGEAEEEKMPDIGCVWIVPYVLFASEILFALGSGMTVKFFPLFFINDLHLSPVSVQIIYLILPLLMAALNGIGEKVAKCIGRIPTSVLFKLCGLACLVTMALIKDWVAPPAAQGNATLLDAAV